MSRPGDFERAVVDVVRHIPTGQVMSYGEVAEDAGFPGAARAVGNLMRVSTEEMPWWRVVGSGGRITSGSAEQGELLRREGWSIENGRIGRLHRSEP
jgi:methylated-DNA-protein-cysteine methyltransferase-like protein